MRKAAKIAVTRAHERAMRAMSSPGMFEYEIEAEYIHEFRRHDATISYPPIVGAGANSPARCTTSTTTQRLKDGDLLLIDAGCEYDYYASDVTRTMPVSGRFSAPNSAPFTRLCLKRSSLRSNAP